MSSLGIAMLAGLGGMVGWGFADFFAKKTIDRLGDVAALFWSQLFGLVPLIVLFAFTRDMPTMRSTDALWIALLGIGSAAAYVVLYAGFGKGAISVLSPVLASMAAFTVFFSVVLFNETIQTSQWFAIGVVLLGVVAISTTFEDFMKSIRGSGRELTRGMPQVFAAAVAFGLWIALLDRFLGTRDWVLLLLLVRATTTLAVAVYARATGQSLAIQLNDRGLVWSAAAVGVCDTAAYAAVSYGLANTTHTAIVAVLSATFSLPTMLLARAFLRERIALSQKFAAAVILAGVALVSIQ